MVTDTANVVTIGCRRITVRYDSERQRVRFTFFVFSQRKQRWHAWADCYVNVPCEPEDCTDAIERFFTPAIANEFSDSLMEEIKKMNEQRMANGEESFFKD